MHQHPEIDTLKCVLLDMASFRRLIGCVTPQVFDCLMAGDMPNGKPFFSLFYPVEVHTGKGPGGLMSTMYEYIPSRDTGGLLDPVIRVNWSALDLLYAYEENTDEKLHIIYDIEARHMVIDPIRFNRIFRLAQVPQNTQV